MLLPMTGSSCIGEGSTGADNPGADAGDVPSGSSGVDGLEPEVNLFAQGRAFVLARYQQLLPCPSLDHVEDGLVDMSGPPPALQMSTHDPSTRTDGMLSINAALMSCRPADVDAHCPSGRCSEGQRVHHDPRGTTGSELWLLQIAGHQRAKKRAMSHARSLQPWVSPKINERRY